MRATIFAALCLGLAIPTAAPAVGPTGKNPVLDLSSLIQPGEWAFATTIEVNGKPQPAEQDSSCIKPGDVRDFLNQADSPTSVVEHYRLDGNHLHLTGDWIVSGRKTGTIEYDMIFDDRDRSHGSMKVVTTRNAITTAMKIEAHRIGACTQES
ncbi:MAG: DUF3617 domain-containing protein [Gammaproteobacteria bacterium]